MSTYVPIQAITLSAAAATVTFTGIPQNYTDLVLVINASRSSGTGANEGFLRFNSDSSALYSNTSITGNGTSASSARRSGDTSLRDSIVISEVNSTTIIQLQNYSNTTTNKTTLARANSANWGTQTAVGLYRSTSAITSIEIGLFFSVLYSSGSTFTLYGVGSGSPKAFGGDRVVTDGTYWYHAFTSSGRFEPAQNITADILVVAGGGGGGAFSGSGGGAGGLQFFSNQSLSVAETITVGSGGTGGGNSGSGTGWGSNGNNSSFGSLTASVGGGGGASNKTGAQRGPNTGGSGGGGNVFVTTGANGTTGQGNKGGDRVGIFNGGGGGAGEAGNTDAQGEGGDGSSAYSSWGSATSTGQNVSGTFWYAGGGANDSGNSGGASTPGGLGGGGTQSTSGTVNTGGGGGAWDGTGSAGNGGSGIVIVRYAV